MYCNVITLFFEINKPMKISYTKHSVINLNHLKNPCFENVEKKISVVITLFDLFKRLFLLLRNFYWLDVNSSVGLLYTSHVLGLALFSFNKMLVLIKENETSIGCEMGNFMLVMECEPLRCCKYIHLHLINTCMETLGLSSSFVLPCIYITSSSPAALFLKAHFLS